MARFIKEDVLYKIHNISKIDVLNNENNVCVKKINLGYSTRYALRSIATSDKEVLQFRSECLTILKTFCDKLLSKSPLKCKLVKGLSFCDPAVISSSTQVALLRLKTTLTHFVDHQWVSPHMADIIDRHFAQLFSNKLFMEKVKNYERSNTRIDHFWGNVCLQYDISNVQMDLLKKIFVMSHGNATVERGFSINKECVIENLSEEFLVAQCVVWAGIQSAGGDFNQIDITKEMIMTVRSANSYYKTALNEKKKILHEQEEIKKQKK